jgi:hypothetical protein
MVAVYPAYSPIYGDIVIIAIRPAKAGVPHDPLDPAQAACRLLGATDDRPSRGTSTTAA